MQCSHLKTSQSGKPNLRPCVRRIEFEWSANVYCGLHLDRSSLHSDDFHLLTTALQRTIVAVCHLPSLPLTFIKTVFSWSYYSRVVVGSIGMMAAWHLLQLGIEKRLNHSKVSKPQQTFNYCSASRRHARKSAAGPVALQRDEIETENRSVTGWFMVVRTHITAQP